MPEPSPVLREQDLALLAAPERWQFAAPGRSAPPASLPRVPAARRAWSKVHQHSHAHSEFLVCLTGRTLFAAGSVFYRAVPGSVFYLAPGMAHDEFYPEVNHLLRHLWISLVAGKVLYSVHALGPDGHAQQSGGRAMLSLEELGFAEETCLRPVAEPAGNLRIAGAFHLIAAGILAPPRPGSSPEAATQPNFQSQVVHTITQYLDETLGRDVTAADLARLAGYSKFHFLRLFKEHTGMTVQQYTDRVRLRTTRAMLAEQRTQREISERLGFSCPAAFSRWYRRYR